MKVILVGSCVIILCFVLGILFVDGQSKPCLLLAFVRRRTITS